MTEAINEAMRDEKQGAAWATKLERLEPEWLKVESLDLEAQGVAHNLEGKVVFIEDALPGEEVQVRVGRRKNNWEQATMTSMRRESSQRVRPKCPHFGTCGGCKM